MKYTIRTKEGMMVGEMSGEVANTFMAQAKGFWRSYKTDDYEGSCFELTEDGCYRTSLGQMRTFFWKGYIIIPGK